jgi:hypothetical protein
MTFIIRNFRLLQIREMCVIVVNITYTFLVRKFSGSILTSGANIENLAAP